MSSQPLPTILDLTPPSSSVLPSVLSYLRKHTSVATTNHSIRPVYFMLLFARKMPNFQAAISAGLINLETAMLALLMHDLGWATTKELLSKDKRFEVDGAELAVKFIQSQIHHAQTTDAEWTKARLEELWTAIALHTTASIGQHHPNPTMPLVQLSILTDFFGPHPPPFLPPVVTVDEYKAIVQQFPREGFKQELISIFCGMCRDKPQTTFDNFASDFGKKYGLDGEGTGKEEFAKRCEENNVTERLMAGLERCAEYDGHSSVL